MLFMVALVSVLFVAVVALGYRLWKLRQVGGTAAILRDVPAVGGQGWRHGVMRYRGGEAGFYRLSSLRWWPDRTLSRRGLEIVSRRAPRGDEFDIMTEQIMILELRDAGPERGGRRTWGADGLGGPTDLGLQPPGRQRTSPCGFATRDRIKSRSDSRLRYFAGSTLIESPWVSIARHAERSARRATVRTMCSSADKGVPPGKTNEFNAGRPWLNSSHHDSRRSI